MIHCNNKLLYDQTDSKLIRSTIYWKKTSQTVTINKDDCVFSVVYCLLKIKSKPYIFENIFTIIKWQNKSRWQKSAMILLSAVQYNAFHVDNRISICQILWWVRKTASWNACFLWVRKTASWNAFFLWVTLVSLQKFFFSTLTCFP